MEFKNSETLKNLTRAFAAECQDGAFYQYMADEATQNKLSYISTILKQLATNEMAHAKVFYDYIGKHCSGGVDMVEIKATYPMKYGKLDEMLLAKAKNEEMLCIRDCLIAMKTNQICEHQGEIILSYFNPNKRKLVELKMEYLGEESIKEKDDDSFAKPLKGSTVEMTRIEEKLDFKANLNRLDEILETLNDENVSIDESLKLYEEGQKIVKLLEDSLLEAEEKVAKVIETK